jgi:hypothetical protein
MKSVWKDTGTGQIQATTRRPVNDECRLNTTDVLTEKLHLVRSLSLHAKRIAKELRSLCTPEMNDALWELVQGRTWGGETCVVDKR